MKKRFLTLVAILSGFIVIAQTDKGDELFKQWDYSGAVLQYEKAATTHPTQDVYFKIGECYRKMGSYGKALTAYDKVNSMGDYKVPGFYLNYGLMLKTSGNYDSAKSEFIKYSYLEPSDPKGKLLANSCDVAVNDNKEDVSLTVNDISTLNTANSEFCPVLFKDGIVFTTDRPSFGHTKTDMWSGDPYLQICAASKNGNDSTFGNAVPLNSAINLKYHDGPACFSKNYDTIYFTRVNKDLKGSARKKLGIERSKIFYATMVNGKWGNVKPFFLNNDTFSVGHPSISRDGSRLYFASDMPGGMGGIDIWYCTRDGDGWSQPINAGPKINTPGTENYPAIDSAGNLYFSSDGYVGFGGLDICRAMNVNGTFTQAEVLKCPLNSSADDFGMVFLNDGKRGYFSSNRAGGKGSDDIYYFDMGTDTTLTTNIYVIGYKKSVPPPAPVAMVKDTAKPIPSTPQSTAPIPVAVEKDGVEPDASLDLHINFDLDKFNLRADAIAKLGQIVDYLKTHTDQMVQVNGYTDISGQEEYNEYLSTERANAASRYIVNKGIDHTRVITIGYGPHPPLLNEGVYNRVKQEVNRRVQFQWLPMTKENMASAGKSGAMMEGYAPAGFSIEVKATKTEVPDNSPEFKNVDGIIHIKYENGYYCYYYGYFTSKPDADSKLKELQDKGVSGMVVGLSDKIYYGGKPIPVMGK